MHKNVEPTIEWKVAIKQRLAAKVEHRLMDILSRKPRYGMRSRLLNKLLERWLEENPSDLDAPELTEEEIDAIMGGRSPKEDENV